MTRISAHRLAAALDLWSEAYESPDPAAARAHLVTGFTNLVGADIGLLTRALDFHDGGRAVMTENIIHGMPSATEARALLEPYREAANDPAIAALMRIRRPQVARTRRELVGDRRWYGSDFVQRVRLGVGVDDAIFGAAHVEDDVAIGVGMSRARKASPFTAEDRALTELLLARSRWLQGTYRSVEHVARLSRRQRETLDLLLSGSSEKEVASRLGISSHSVHTHVRELYRKLGVRRRSELVALCCNVRAPRIANG